MVKGVKVLISKIIITLLGDGSFCVILLTPEKKFAQKKWNDFFVGCGWGNFPASFFKKQEQIDNFF